MQANESNKGELKESLKATSLFGGTQVFSILISIIKNKLVALLIGPAGIGIVELFNSTIHLINTSTNFSLSISAVRDVTVAYKSGDTAQYTHTLSLFSKVIWFTGMLGTIVCLLGSPLWSRMTFGSYDYTLSFVFLSVILLLTQLNSGKIVLLQSTGHYKEIAASNILGNLVGLATVVPIYYFFKIDGIVAVLILTSLTAFLITRYFARTLKFKYEKMPFDMVRKEGGKMISQGLYLSINYIFSAVTVYVLRIFISKLGGVEILGLFTSGFLIVNTYVGMVFQSMSQEYYPRLSSLSGDKSRFNETISNQIYLLLLIIGPLVFFFLIFSQDLLHLLYSEKFVGASLMMSLAMIGVVFQAPSYCMGFAFLAKGDNKSFLLWETIAKVLLLTFDMLFFYFWGLKGIGISFIVSYVYYTIQCAFVCKGRYGLKIPREIIVMMVIYLICGLFIVFMSQLTNFWITLGAGSVILAVSSWYSYKKLSAIIDVVGFIKSKFKR